MAVFLPRFLPGRCKNTCDCSRCSGRTPFTWSVTILGKTYTLTRSQVTPLGIPHNSQCFWMLLVDETIDCAHVDWITLDLDQLGYVLTVTGDGTQRRRWRLNATYPVDCAASQTLPDATAALATCYGSTDTARIVPGPAGGCCGGCEGSSGSGTATHSCANGCCTQADAPLAVDIDLGAGGWTDKRCNQCNEIRGVYTLDASDPLLGCGWFYGIASFCDLTGCDEGFDLRIELARRNVSGQCRWELAVQLTLQTSECAGIEVEAVYQGSLESTAAACALAAPITLTKVSDTACGAFWCACNGALPDTCTIQAV